MSEPTIHACAIVLGRFGVLIEGPSGSGKTRLADALVEATRANGAFARWVGDDRLLLDITPRACIAKAATNIEGQKEHAHLGIVTMSHLSQARMDLSVKVTAQENLERLPEEQVDERGLPQILVPKRLLTVSVPLIQARLALLD